MGLEKPAYGHCLKRQPRHSIETGTTNADTYLPKQTGNRRFWPMKVLAEIDIEKLTRDRLQLWGEAAHWQSKGESLALPREYWADAGVEQDARRVADAWEDELAGACRQTSTATSAGHAFCHRCPHLDDHRCHHAETCPEPRPPNEMRTVWRFPSRRCGCGSSATGSRTARCMSSAIDALIANPATLKT